MVITKGSKFKFNVTFSVPKNLVFKSIKIDDTLAKGLSYELNKAVITSTKTPTPTPTPPGTITYIDNSIAYVDSSTNQVLSFLIQDLNEIQPSEKNEITVSIPVEVVDVDALLADQAAIIPPEIFKNTATISPYSVENPGDTDVPISDPLPLDDPLTFTGCSIYGLGIGYTVTRDAGKDVPLVFALSNVDSSDTDTLVYKATLTVSEYLDLIYDAEGSSSVLNSTEMFFHGQPVTNIITSAQAVTNADGTKTVTITYPHRGAYSGELLYIELDTITNQTLADSDVTSFHCPLTVDLINTATDPDTVNCSAPPFDILITVSDPDPSIDEGSKTIVVI